MISDEMHLKADYCYSALNLYDTEPVTCVPSTI